ncbi:hypothetical protein OpiT1DRAFT_02848 [Opitutaceae bacterium TAV1]|nr:hypothetical protein OpiT1DRAFT_02848 [Opitutaceae bacterium TAV1]
MKPEQKKTVVTVEDLLRLKRAERPPEEFWARFETELRTKQLAASIEPRPWWLGIALLWRKSAPFALPAGALAALALTVVGVQRVAFAPAGSGPSPAIVVASQDTRPQAAATVAATARPASSAPVSAAQPTAPVRVAATETPASPPPPSGDSPAAYGQADKPAAISRPESGSDEAILVAAASAPDSAPSPTPVAAPAPRSRPATTPSSILPPAVPVRGPLVAVAALDGMSPASPPLSSSVVDVLGVLDQRSSGLVISPGGSQTLAPDADDWAGAEHDSFGSLLATATSPLSGQPAPLLASAGHAATPGGSSEASLAPVRGDSRVARLIVLAADAESYASSDSTGSQDGVSRSQLRRVNDDDVLPSAVRRLVGGGDRVSFRF